MQKATSYTEKHYGQRNSGVKESLEKDVAASLWHSHNGRGNMKCEEKGMSFQLATNTHWQCP